MSRADDDPDDLTQKQANLIYAEAAVSSIPVLGSALAKMTFGVLTERRMNRVERTLAEVVQALDEKAAKRDLAENFVNLLERVAPELARAVDEEKRIRFRDLLTNAAELPEGSPEWGAAGLAADLLKDIETPGLAILATLADLDAGERAFLTARPPVSELVRGVTTNAELLGHPGPVRRVIPYEWVVVEHWYRLLGDLRLVMRGGHGPNYYENACLIERGRFLAKWVVRTQTQS